jgi:radical SAM protein with 4Fe4S-binding SPASM domain
MADFGGVRRNPNVVWRGETKGGETEGLLLFNYQTRSVHFLEGHGKKIWEDIDTENTDSLISGLVAEATEKEVHDFLKGLEDRKLLSFYDEIKEKPLHRELGSQSAGGGMWSDRVYFDAPLFVQFDCTNNCNLRCRHCVTRGGEVLEGELSTIEALDLIRDLREMGVFQIGFSGGEPLMRKDIFTLMEEVKNLGMKVQLTTNATLIDNNAAKKLSELDPITVGVSLEGGTKASYEYFRGKDNFEKFVDGVELMKEYNLPVKFKSAVMRKNIGEINSIIELALRLGIEAVDMFLFYPQGRGDTMATEKLNPYEIRDFLSTLSQKRKELEGKIAIDVDDKPNAFLVDPSLSHSTCGAGVYWAEVLPTGDVVPCVFFSETVAGNVRKGGFKRAWNSMIWEPFRDRRGLNGKCGTCVHSARCGGGCRANGYVATGDFLAEDGLCWYEG